jgi:hypothetical protein
MTFEKIRFLAKRWLQLVAGLVFAVNSAVAADIGRTRDEGRLRAATQPSAEFRRFVFEGISLRELTVELTRRGLLLCKSPLMRRVPSSPAMPAELPSLVDSPNSMVTITQAVAGRLWMSGYADGELSALADFLESAEGRRAFLTSEAFTAMDRPLPLVDVNTGATWEWSVQPLRAYMVATGRQAQFDAAVNEAAPGGAAAIADIQGRLDEEVPKVVATTIQNLDWKRAGDAFAARMPINDTRAYNRPIFMEFLERYQKAIPAAQQLLTPQPLPGGLVGALDASPESVARACKAATSAACSEADSKALLEMAHYDWTAGFPANISPFVRRLRSVPAAVCSAE